MSETLKIDAQLRESAGKGAARAARRNGIIPGVLYGDKKTPISFGVDRLLMNKLMYNPHLFNTLIEIKIDGKNHKAIARDLQVHPVTDIPMHIDLLRVSSKTRLNIEIPINFQNQEEAPGLKRGGVMNIIDHSVSLYVRADNIPAEVTLDLTGAEIGDSIMISKITLPDGSAFAIEDENHIIASITAPSALKSEDEETAEAAEGEEAGTAAEGDSEE